jgi:ABC-type branched-subunit amino acid transport system ATPase component
VFDKIREVCDERRLPLLMIEQNVERALELADRVCILVRGAVSVERDAADVTVDEVGAIFLERGTLAGGRP